MIEGIIVKANSGFYYVKKLSNGEDTESGIIECHARGIFRKKHLSPLVGDRVSVTMEANSGTIEEIHGRKNSLIRPPVANIDFLMIVASTTQPVPNLLVIDRLTVTAREKGIEPYVVFSKGDLEEVGDLCDIYNKAGITSFAASGKTGEGIEKIKKLIKGRVGAFTGNSGVGKSTILNALEPSLSLDTGEISKKLGRGRHTTRIVELFSVCGGFIADTPGFASLDLLKFEPVLKDDLQYAFPEFEPYINKCRFTGCSHTKENGCAVLEAVKSGIIPKSRHESYLAMYEEAKNIKEWELKK